MDVHDGSEQHSIAEARANLPSLVRRAEAGKAIELTRRGEPVAVLLGRREYERLTASSRGFSDAYAAFKHEFDLDDLALDPTQLFGDLREKSKGRKVDL